MRAVDSYQLARGPDEFADWSAAAALGLASGRAITAPLIAGEMPLGFLTVHLPCGPAADGGGGGGGGGEDAVWDTQAPGGPPLVWAEEASQPHTLLQEVCESLGAALFVRRALLGIEPSSGSGDDMGVRRVRRPDHPPPRAPLLCPFPPPHFLPPCRSPSPSRPPSI